MKQEYEIQEKKEYLYNERLIHSTILRQTFNILFQIISLYVHI